MDDNQHEHRQEVIRGWQALLDGELVAAEAERVRALIAADPELSKAFAAAQAFDTELKSRLRSLAPATAEEALPPALHAKLLQSLDSADAERAHKRATSPIEMDKGSLQKIGGTTRRSIRAQATTPVRGRLYTLIHSPRWHAPWVKAAALLLAVGIGLLAGALWSPRGGPATAGKGGERADSDTSKDGEKESTPLIQVGSELPDRTRSVLTDLVNRGNDMVMREGSHDLEEVESYADQIGFMAKLPPHTNYPRWRDIPMQPINLGRGMIAERGYESVCFCTGDIADQLDRVGGGEVSPLDQSIHKRAVLFIFKGDMLGGVEGVDPGTMAVLEDVSYTVICKFDPEMGMTCFLYTPSAMTAVEARDLAAPLLDAAHARREDDPEGG